MQKEIFIVIIIIIAIVSIDVLTNNYTKKNFGRIDEKLEEIKQIGLSLINEEDKEDELKNKLGELEKDWHNINSKTAFFLEHDELEKINSSMIKFKSYFELEEYTEAIPELENCKFILKHLQDKEAIDLINLF
jgi:hypothetical protein